VGRNEINTRPREMKKEKGVKMRRSLNPRKTVCVVALMFVLVSSFAMVGCVLAEEWATFR